MLGIALLLVLVIAILMFAFSGCILNIEIIEKKLPGSFVFLVPFAIGLLFITLYSIILCDFCFGRVASPAHLKSDTIYQVFSKTEVGGRYIYNLKNTATNKDNDFMSIICDENISGQFVMLDVEGLSLSVPTDRQVDIFPKTETKEPMAAEKMEETNK